MPVVVRDSGKMWNKMGEMEDTKCLIPDRCYATMYQEVISYVKTHGELKYCACVVGRTTNRFLLVFSGGKLTKIIRLTFFLQVNLTWRSWAMLPMSV